MLWPRASPIDSPSAFTMTSAPPRLPVLLSVPHAGRRYAPALLAASRLPASALAILEDPHVDRLIVRGIEAGAAAIVAHVPRAEIDLNRSLDDLDPAMVAPASTTGQVSRRASAGLGLIPSRLAGHGAIWRRALPRAEVDRRIADVHAPYHAAIDDALHRMRDAFGVVVLLDCHSMPPRGRETIVLGDVHGASCGSVPIEAAERVCAAHGMPATRNDPYAGGEIVARHGRPDAGIHAIQIEIDRRAYLAADLRAPGLGFGRVAALIGDIVGAVGDAVLSSSYALAAE